MTYSSGTRPADAAEQIAREVGRLAPQGLRGAASVASSGGSLVVHPLGVSGGALGYLAVGVPAGRPIRGAVAAAVSLLSLALQRSDAAGSERRRVLRAAADLLVQGRSAAADALLAVLEVELPVEPVVVLVAPVPPEGAERVLPGGVLATVHGGDLLVLAPTDLVAEASRALQRHGPVGLSRAVGRAQVPGGVAEARAARSTATRATDVVAFADVLARGVPALVDEAAARTWAEQLLAPLRGDGEGLRSLRTWLAHHGQLQPAAAELGLHRHTLRHRLARVEELLGRPLSSPQTRMDLWFALQRL